MPSNAVALWLAQLVVNATIWEIAAALVGVAAVGYAAWGALDNILDLRALRHDGQESGPLRIAASCLLVANILFTLGWLGYTHVALTAAYLPPRDDMATVALSEIAVMRLLYGVFGLLAQATLRWMRTRLRRLSRAEWEPFFGEAAAWKAKFHASQAELHRQRAEKHEIGQQATADMLRVGLLERILRQHDIVPPPRSLPKENDE